MSSTLPAIAGGEKAKTVPFGKSRRYGDEEHAELIDALEQGTLFYAAGQKVKALERAFAAHCGVKHAIACSSGTAAIHAALMALGISPGDEVITSGITDMGTISPILFQGAVPIFADLDPLTATLSPAAVADAITDKTRAVLAVHLGGNACDLAALSAVCEERGVTLIEDCAQAFGCRYAGKPIGSIGKIGCFSYNEFKHISCGDGGVVVTDDDALAERLRLSTDKGYNRRPDALVKQPQFLAANYRMTELQGAVALAQLGKLESIIARRRAWCSALTERVQGLPGLRLPTPTAGCEPSWWFYLMQAIGYSADELAKALQAEGLPVAAHYIGTPVYAYPVFTEHSAFARGGHAYESYTYGLGLCPETERILRDVVLLFVNEAYTEQDLDETVAAIRKVACYLAG